MEGGLYSGFYYSNINYYIYIQRDKEDRVVDLVDEDKVKLIMSFMDTYSQKNRELSTKISGIDEKLEEVLNKIDVLNENMKKVPNHAKEKKRTERFVHIYFSVGWSFGKILSGVVNNFYN